MGFLDKGEGDCGLRVEILHFVQDDNSEGDCRMGGGNTPSRSASGAVLVGRETSLF